MREGVIPRCPYYSREWKERTANHRTLPDMYASYAGQQFESYLVALSLQGIYELEIKQPRCRIMRVSYTGGWVTPDHPWNVCKAGIYPVVYSYGIRPCIQQGGRL